MSAFQKDKSPSPDGWTIEFYLGFFELLGEYLLRFVEEVRQSRTMLRSFNIAFTTLIAKVDKVFSFGDSRSISL